VRLCNARLSPFFRYRTEHPLGYRLLGRIVLFSSLLALLTTAIQLLTDYRVDVRAIDERMNQIEHSYLNSVANSLWMFDATQIQTEMNGILSLPDIKFVEIDTPQRKYTSGAAPEKYAAITRGFPLYYQDSTERPLVGTLKVSASLEGVYQRLQERTFVILATNAVKNFLTAVFILWIFQRLVTRHLGTMANYARGLSLDHLHQPLVLRRKIKRNAPRDELDQVTSAINEMRQSLIAGIEERQRADTLLRASREQLRDIINNSTALIYLKDTKRRYLMINQEFERLFHISADAIVGKTDFDLFPRAVAEALCVNDRRVIQECSPLKLEETIPQSDGLHTYLSVKFPLCLQGDIYAVCSISTDITDRKRAAEELARQKETAEAAKLVAEAAKETAEAANQAKDRFLAMLSHELRTPLTPVLGGLNALEASAGPEEQRTLKVMKRNIELQRRIIDDLLDLTRIAHGNINLQLEAVNAHETIQKVLETCQTKITARRLQVTQDLSAMQFWVEADSARLQQVIWNIVQNAARYTPAGGRLAIHSYNPEACKLALEFSDTGIGIEPADLERVFVPFEQVDRTLTSGYGGLGLGLAIAKEYIKAQGGTIAVESKGRGQGTTFIVELKTTDSPRPLEQPKEHPPPDLKQRPDAMASAVRRILLIEDHTDTLELLKRVLTRRGYDVVGVEDVRSALQTDAESHFDLIVSDIGLPDGSGYDLLKTIRSRHPMPAIAMSGFGTDDDIARSRAVGFAEHLVKPVDFELLIAAIRRVKDSQTPLVEA